MSALHAILLGLGDPNTQVSDRRNLTRLLREQLRWLPSWLRRKFRKLSDDDVDTVIDHVCDKASFGAQRYRGDRGEESASAWVKAVARNRAFDIFRKRQREQNAAPRVQAYEASRQQQECEEAEDKALTQNVWRCVCQYRENSGTPRTARADEQFMELGLEHLWGNKSTDEQVFDQQLAQQGVDPSELRKARNVVYQRRRRGRVALARLLREMVTRSLLDGEDAERFAHINRLPWPPPSRSKTGNGLGRKSRDDA